MIKKYKHKISKMLLYGIPLIFSSNISSHATDLTNQSIVYSLSGDSEDKYNDVLVLSSNEVVTVGESYSDDLSFSRKGDYDAIITKYNKYGDLDWIKSFGGSSRDCFYSTTELSDGGIIAVGYSSSIDAGFEYKGGWYDAIIVKFDKDGNQEWFKNFGGSNYDYFYSVTELSNGDIIAVGESDSTDAGFVRKGKTDGIIIKYDKDGNELWVKNFEGSNYDYFYSVTELSNGDIIAVGNSFSNNAGFEHKGNSDAIIIKYDKDGNQLWVKNFGGSKWDFFKSVIELSNGDIIAVGESDSIDAGFEYKGGYYDAIIVKFDKDGNQLWVKNFGGSDEDCFTSVIELSNGDIIAVGYSDSNDAGFNNKGSVDAIIVKYDKDGNQEWFKSFGGSGEDCFNSVSSSSNDEIYMVGVIDSKDLYFDTSSEHDAILVKYNESWDEELLSDIYTSRLADINRYNINLRKIIPTKDNHFIIVGSSSSKSIGVDNKGGNDAIITKLESNGTQKWIKSWGTSGDDSFTSVIETSDGGLVCLGYTTQGGSDMTIIVKYDQDGNELWNNSWDSINNMLDGFVIEKNNGELIIIDNGMMMETQIFKCSQDGQEITLINSISPDYGIGEVAVGFTSVKETDDGDYIAIGYTLMFDDSLPIGTKSNGFIAKYDTDFSEIWSNTYDECNISNILTDMIETENGEYIIIGLSYNINVLTYEETVGSVIIKCNDNGDELWKKEFTDSLFYSLLKTSDDNLLITGSTFEIESEKIQGFIGKYNLSGDEIWFKEYESKKYSDDTFTCISSAVETKDKEYITTSVNVEDFSTVIFYKTIYGSSSFIAKYDNNGDEMWSKTIDVESVATIEKINSLRGRVNSLDDEALRIYLNKIINILDVALEKIELKTSSAGIDIYIKCRNSLSLSLSTNHITFEEFDGIDDMIKDDAIELTVQSTLPYNLNAYLASEIQGSDSSNIMNKQILQLKEDGETNYQYFNGVDEKMILKSNCLAGESKKHLIDFKLKGGITYKSDVYRTVVKFEAEQI